MSCEKSLEHNVLILRTSAAFDAPRPANRSTIRSTTCFVLHDVSVVGYGIAVHAGHLFVVRSD
jgi:hypothetical protein